LLLSAISCSLLPFRTKYETGDVSRYEPCVGEERIQRIAEVEGEEETNARYINKILSDFHLLKLFLTYSLKHSKSR
jgi:hypothetical protein